jgi:predicted glycoside hydrolase/deacetylase ChbG (UPF0249 family)
MRAPKRAEVIAEWEAQIEMLVRLGIRPAHIDSRHHVQTLPEVRDADYEIVSQRAARSMDPEMTERLRGMGVPCTPKTLPGWFDRGILQILAQNLSKKTQGPLHVV